MEEELAEDTTQNYDSDDGEEFTAEKVLQEIENAWMNEKFSPEILPHKSDFVDCMLQQISHMEENMKKLKKTDIRFTIHKLEIDRIRFVIASYLRTRLEKIEQYAIDILSEESKRSPEESYLTEGEIKFAREYLAGIETLFKTVALQHMPNNLQDFDLDILKVKPNLNSHVFIRVIKTTDKIIVPGISDQDIELIAGSQHIVQYQTVASLVKDGTVKLI